jgi:hypothetical protein
LAKVTWACRLQGTVLHLNVLASTASWVDAGRTPPTPPEVMTTHSTCHVPPSLQGVKPMGDDPMALLGLEGALKHYYYYYVMTHIQSILILDLLSVVSAGIAMYTLCILLAYT